MSTVIAPTRTHTYTYRTTTEWLGRRNGRLAVSGKEPVVLSSPPEFRGEKGFLSPGELFIGAVESCFMLTFVPMIEKYHLPVEAYFSEASGVLELAAGDYRFTRIVIKPTIVINDATGAGKVLEIVEHARRDCLVANSIRTELTIEPDIVLSASE